MNLHYRVGLDALGCEPSVESVDVLGLEPVEPVPAVAERVDAVDLLINAAGIEDSARSSGPPGGWRAMRWWRWPVPAVSRRPTWPRLLARTSLVIRGGGWSWAGSCPARHRIVDVPIVNPGATHIRNAPSPGQGTRRPLRDKRELKRGVRFSIVIAHWLCNVVISRRGW